MRKECLSLTLIALLGLQSFVEAGRETRPDKILGLLSLEGNEIVLDINCGDRGVVSALEKCLPKGHVISSDYRTTPSIQQPVAAATCFHCLQWLAHPAHVLCEMERSLQPGGRCLLVATPQESGELQILQLALNDPRSGGGQEYFPLRESWSVDDYRHAMWNLGFDILHFEVIRAIKAYHTREELQEAAKSFADRLHLQDLSLDFPQVFAEYAFQHYSDPDSGAVLLPTRTVVILGVKRI